MTKEEEFLNRLINTFKQEAKEHLQAISTLLIDIENNKDGPPGREPIESVFRETHSLKGGARSVNLITVEGLCSAMESIFSKWKTSGFFYTKPLFNIFHKGINILNQFLESGFKDKETEIGLVTITHGLKNMDFSEVVSSTPIEAKADKAVGEKKEGNQEKNDTTRGEEAREPHGAHETKHDTIRVNIDKLDKLMTRSEEMIAFKLKYSQFAFELEHYQYGLKKIIKNISSDDRLSDNAKIGMEINRLYEIEKGLGMFIHNFSGNNLVFQKQVDALMDDTRETLMVPCHRLFESMPKMVRDLAAGQNKEVETIIKGDGIEVDRRVLEHLKDPVVHILRNAIDHGIEGAIERKKAGKTTLSRITIEVGQCAGDKIEIKISDDGRGIDPENIRAVLARKKIMAKKEAEKLPNKDIINYVFHSGFTTSNIITDISGRGLGLAIARNAVENLDGAISIESEVNEGTEITMKIPVSVSSARGIFAECAGQVFVVPTSAIGRVIRLPKKEVKTIESKQAFTLDGETISLVYLPDVLKMGGKANTNDIFINVLIISNMGDKIGFIVDAVLYEQEIIVKPLGNMLKQVKNIKGATVIGTGQVVPVLNPPDLFALAIKGDRSTKLLDNEPESSEKKKLVLIAEDSITSRMLLKDILESAGYEVQTANDGAEALACLRGGEFDALVSDIEMPRMNGFELTKIVRSEVRLADLPVVLVTALKKKEDREKGLEVGANAYIEKGGFNPGNLINTLQKLV